MSIVKKLIFIGVLFLFTVDCYSKNKQSKPNVILVFIDDMGWEDLSCFGNADAQTPNIDKLASEGICFEQFYVNSPICSPSRVAISTGQYPQRYNITSYLAHQKDNEERGMANWLNPEAPMLARCLKEAGYATGHFGKWHMGGQRDVNKAPEITEYGFDESLTNFEGMGAKLLPLTKDENGNVGKIWENAESLGEPVTWMQRSEITSGFVDAAISFMEKAQNENKPFYINLWPDDVHSPYWPPFEEYGLAKEAGKRGLYLAVLEAMDQQFAKLFDFIKNNKELSENTLILICSDNGPEKDAGRAGNLKGYKTHLYEGGIRSSMVVWGPGFINKNAKGSRNKESVFSAIDLVPSLLSFTGTKVPEGANYDGENVIATILGEAKKSRESPIFYSRPPDRKNYYGFEDLPDLAMRHGKWKLLCDYDGSGPELYNIIDDLGETNNLATTYPELNKLMTEQVVQWWNSMPVLKDKKQTCVNLNAENFQKTIDGKSVNLYFLRNGDITMAVTNFGGRIVSLCTPDINGTMADVVLGFKSIDEYLAANEAYHGALIGRVGNRIAGGQFELDGKTYDLPLNNGPNHLHGGPKGFHNQVWDVKSVSENSIVLTYLSEDGEMGYPGNLSMVVEYELTPKNEVMMKYTATTDKRTPVNLTNHAFFNLGGEAGGSINNHILTINADYYTAVDETLIPLGENVPVNGTPFDFRKGKSIGQDLGMQQTNEQLKNGMGYDHNFALKKDNGRMSLAAIVVETKSGRKMEVFTEEPGIQFYGGNFFDGSDTGKLGKPLNYRESFALETQHFPDSPNHKDFPSILLNPGETYQTQTIYKFSVVE
ncbi:Galactose mutarotase [Mariniphaga anaerophila]|uniref:Galactose mutarotase n=1 Tax=Mariniphaga anaerophila TaxID=1484053 RepID=A0A1M4UCS0_9BACT|nr:galactose-1-epimerase [Mariniphaga anaerophila]SHE54525.1 Galactose mutarotase [Mariniphaga anaerophila]